MIKTLNMILSNTAIMITIVILCCFYMFVIIKPLFELNETIVEYEQTVSYLQSENDNLVQTLQMINDESTRQKMARQLYKLSEEDEILFEFPDD